MDLVADDPLVDTIPSGTLQTSEIKFLGQTYTSHYHSYPQEKTLHMHMDAQRCFIRHSGFADFVGIVALVST